MLISCVLCTCSHICLLLLFDISLLLSDHLKMLQAHLSVRVYACMYLSLFVNIYIYKYIFM